MVFAGAILLMLLALSVLIIVHEMGHFWVARLFGFQTPVFGFGLPFGPSWTLGNWGGTQIRLHALLLGGYVAIPELGDESSAEMGRVESSVGAVAGPAAAIATTMANVGDADNPYGVPLKPFRKFPIWQRALVAFAGPGFNILFAWLVMFIIVNTLGDPSQKVIVAELPPENPIAAKAGVKVGDQVLSIDKTRIDSTDDIIFYLGSRPDTLVTVHVARDGSDVDLPMTTNSHGKVGMALGTQGPMTYRKIDLSPIESVGFATQKLERLTVQMLQGIGMMFDGIFHPQASGGKAGSKHSFGFKDLHGVLAVVKIGADIASQDWSQLPWFVVMISMDLAIINLVPWPGLDGSHLAFMAFEAVRGQPLEERRRGTIVQWGFVSLLVLMAVIMYNDIEALVTGKLDIKLKGKQAQEKAPDGAKGAAGDKGTDGAKTPDNGQKPPDPASTSGTSTTPDGASTPTSNTATPDAGTTPPGGTPATGTTVAPASDGTQGATPPAPTK